MSIYKLLSSGSYRTYNFHIAKKLGCIHSAILLSDLCDRLEYHSDEGETLEIEGELWFYYTVDKCTERTIMSAKVQAKAMKNLIDLGLIKQKNRGVPPKRYFCLNEQKIVEFALNSKEEYKNSQTADLNMPKRQIQKCPKGRYIYEPHTNEPKEDNNPAPKRKASKKPVVVPLELQELDLSEKNQLSVAKKLHRLKAKECADQELGKECIGAPVSAELLVRRVKAWESSGSALKACYTILRSWDTWEDKSDPEDIEEENKSFAMSKMIGAKVAKGIQVEILNKTFEIGIPPAQSIAIEYTDKKFKEKLMKALEKYEIEPMDE